MNKFYMLGIMALVGLGFIYYAMQNSKSNINSQTITQTKKNTAVLSPTQNQIQDKPSQKQTFITLKEVEKHNTPSDCWFVIESFIYNVTEYIAMQKHPGGSVILQGCGKDATFIFSSKAGKNKDHSDTAYSMLQKYQIGILKK